MRLGGKPKTKQRMNRLILRHEAAHRDFKSIADNRSGLSRRAVLPVPVSASSAPCPSFPSSLSLRVVLDPFGRFPRKPDGCLRRKEGRHLGRLPPEAKGLAFSQLGKVKNDNKVDKLFRMIFNPLLWEGRVRFIRTNI